MTVKKQPPLVGKKQPRLAAIKQPLAAAKKQPLAAAKKSLDVVWKKESCTAAKKKPCAAIEKELCVVAEKASEERFGRQPHSLGTLETLPEEEVLVVEEVSARAEGKQHRVLRNEKLPDLKNFSKQAFLVLEEAMGTVPCVQDIVAESLVYAMERALDRCLVLEFELGDKIDRESVAQLGSCRLGAYGEQVNILHRFLQEHTILKDRLDVKGPRFGMHTAITQATERRVSQANAPGVVGSQQCPEEWMNEVQLRKNQNQKKKQMSMEQIKKLPVRMRVGKEQTKEEPVKKRLWRV
ncbi:MAG: hypothetical protein Q9176_006128 [Flavoplaca citrina]